jgi:SAM-dependent methyltransferase
MRTIEVLDATASGAVVGRHALWFPALGIKVPFAWGGRLTKYQRAEPGYEPAETIPHELAILRALAEQQMAPPIGDLVRVETLISEHPGAWHADPVGAWGYEMADATTLPPGRFSIERMHRLPIVGSPGAWGDVAKPGNVVNGYVVDVRRSAFDMLRWDGPVAALPRLEQDLEALRARVHRECQFPAGARAEAYQDFWIGGALERGQRRVVERAQAMGFAPQPGDAVLDIGCQSGGFLQLAARTGARAVGVELNPAYVGCARELARSCLQNISIRRMDVVAERDAFLAWVRALFPRGVDHLLLLSMEKHLGERAMFDLIDAIGARRVYVETNAVAVAPTPGAPMKLWPFVAARGGRHVGDTTDRNLRRLYQIEGGTR